MKDQSILKYKTHGTNLVVLPFQEAEKKGTIIIPDSAKKVLNQGTVLKRGAMCSEQIMEGDIVIFGLHTEYRITLDDQMYFVVKEEDVYLSADPKDLELDKSK